MSRGPAITLTGACVRLYINGKPYKEVQNIAYTLDYGEYAIYGIDSPYPQEIATGRASCAGSISGIRVRYSGGIQASNARPAFVDILSSPYISIRIMDRSTGEDLLFIPNAKIGKQSYSIPAKGTVKLSFDFQGLIGMEPLDRA